MGSYAQSPSSTLTVFAWSCPPTPLTRPRWRVTAARPARDVTRGHWRSRCGGRPAKAPPCARGEITMKSTIIPVHEVQTEGVHLHYGESSIFKEVYGFVGTQGTVNLEGVRYTPVGRPSKTLLVFMHPASTLQLLPMPRELA